MKLELNNVSFRYPKEEELLKDLSFTLKENEFIAIEGDNGEGKTTLLKLFLGLLKPTAGTIENSFPRKAFLSQLTFSDGSVFPMTVREIVSLGIKNKPFSFMRKSEYALVDEYLKKVHLYDKRNCSMNELSGGQQQKIRLIKCLISKPDLLVLDEPSSGVDKASRKELFEFIKQDRKENSRTLILVSHLKEDLEYADKVYTIKDKKLVQEVKEC